MKYLSGMVTGIVVGATVGAMVLPQLDRKTQRAVKKAGKTMLGMAEDSYEGMMGIIKWKLGVKSSLFYVKFTKKPWNNYKITDKITKIF